MPGVHSQPLRFKDRFTNSNAKRGMIIKPFRDWKASIAVYEAPRLKLSLWQLCNTSVPFVSLWVLAYLSLSISFWLTFVIDILASGFLIRLFVIFHDCGHQSFFKSRKANKITGFILGIFVGFPYEKWKYAHSVHHATNGNLSRMGLGEIWTLTVDQYAALSPLRKLMYRCYRHPMILFGLGPFFIYLVGYRLNRKQAGIRERFNTYLTNLMLLILSLLLVACLGWKALVFVEVPILYLAGIAGVWLFYVQHQFEESYFEGEETWDYVSAAMQGSSFYQLPLVLQWITGNIGYHHIHHLSPKIPNYTLQNVHHSHPSLQHARTLQLGSSLQSIHFRLWHEKKKKFVSFKDRH